MRIIVLHRGWVVVGKMKEGAEWSSLSDCAVVRRWGTSKGLGELAANGPTSNTILDVSPPMRFPNGAIINTFECDEKKWKGKIK